MLPRINRLKNKKDFEQVFKQGRGFSDKLLFLKVMGNNLAESRFGIVVSQKVARKATARNKTKRKIRAAIRKNLPGIKKGFDVVIVASPGSSAKRFSEIEQTLSGLFKKAKITV